MNTKFTVMRNLFARLLTSILSIFLLLWTAPIFGQFSVSTTTNGIPGGSSMSICEADPGEYFVFDWNAFAGGATTPIIEINLLLMQIQAMI